MPWLHDKPTTSKLAWNRIAIVASITFWVLYILSIIIRQLIDGPQSYNFTIEAFSYALVITFLSFSALMYLIARQGAYERFSKHVRVPHSVLEKHFYETRSAITALIPSYNEEPAVIRKTLLSAALQEYPSMRIVLLIDDNPNPTDPEVSKKLIATRNITNEINELLAIPHKKTQVAFESFQNQIATNKIITPEITQKLADQYSWAATYLAELAERETISDHVDVFFTEQVLLGLANDLELVGTALNQSVKARALLSIDRISQLYQRLIWIFKAEVSYFERKRYASLSKEFNKAMNLNSYIGLMGGTYIQEQTPEGPILVQTQEKTQDLIHIPDSEFLLTLDADSILLRDYCLRLVYFLQQPGNERVAVTQTPYSSFRGAYTRIERLSGATTDIQHILHQGMTHYGATFWVGANAIIRKQAIEKIVEKEWVGGFEIKRYIQDRTVIEDTESSIDLALHGWTLVNYPERLSYSATPPDFGSLVIQRRRWANGGLLILPKFLSYLRRKKNKNELVSPFEIMLRINYMASIAWASFGLIFLLAYPFNGHLLSPLVLLTALPYFIAQANDLKYNGYKYSDIFSIYGFNLILLPVNLAGVIKSIEQAITGKKIPFARTPKVNNRTSTSLEFVIIPIGIVLFSLYILWMNIIDHNIGNALFAGFNAFTATWAIVAYIGIDSLLIDIWIGITDWLFVESKRTTKKKIGPLTENIDWKVVLYYGEKSGIVPHSSLRNIAEDQKINNTKHS
ncbi:glycosyltransferase [bacterium]|nr:glycosyltransferase [bacterium]